MKYRIFAIWAIGITVVWVASGFLMTSFWGMDGRGAAGDMFGAINSLFSGLAFAGIIFTIVIQREELRLQREELLLQRQEVAKSREELAGQKEIMMFQRFETTLFNMISAHKDIVNSITFDNGKTTGMNVFREMDLSIAKGLNGGKDKESLLSLWFRDIDNIDHCFFNYMFIIGQIDSSEFLDDQLKKKYVDIFTNQISWQQVKIMQFFAENHSYEEEKSQLEKYQLLD